MRWQAGLLALLVAELDGRRALILQAGFESSKDRARYQRQVAKALRAPVGLDCRRWKAVELVEEHL